MPRISPPVPLLAIALSACASAGPALQATSGGQSRAYLAGSLVLSDADRAEVRPMSEAVPPASSAPVKFPPGFRWGAATAAHQVEGGLNDDWSRFERQSGVIKHGDTASIGIDHYRRYDADFALAEGMRHNAHRLSLDWSRIEPERGKWNAAEVAHYHDVFRSLKAHGMKPLVTLHHFTNPLWVADQGGWLADQTTLDFARFASFAANEYGGEVDDWITINEPNVYAFQSYDAGIWPPAHKSREEALRVMANLVKGHAAAYHALHAADNKDADGNGTAVRVGLAHHIALFDASNLLNPIDHAQAYFNDKVFNRAFLKAASTGVLDFSIPGVKGVKETLAAAKNSLDFIGVNYYTRWKCHANGTREAAPGAPVNALGWEIYPPGMYRALKLANDYSRLPDGRSVPLVITENGIDDRDGRSRSAFLVDHLRYINKAIQDGMPVEGYMHWTLADNFEWAEGYEPRFGLFRVDRENGLKRVPTPAVEVYRAIAEANALTAEVLATR